VDFSEKIFVFEFSFFLWLRLDTYSSSKNQEKIEKKSAYLSFITCISQFFAKQYFLLFSSISAYFALVFTASDCLVLIHFSFFFKWSVFFVNFYQKASFHLGITYKTPLSLEIPAFASLFSPIISRFDL